jgi:hypothetical protein
MGGLGHDRYGVQGADVRGGTIGVDGIADRDAAPGDDVNPGDEGETPVVITYLTSALMPARDARPPRAAAVPPGRAQRLGLAETAPEDPAWPLPPFEFLRAGGAGRVEARLAGRPDGLGVYVFEFATGRPGDPGEASGPTDAREREPPAKAPHPAGPEGERRHHVAALELGFALPWFAVAARRINQPADTVYPGRRGLDLATGEQRTDREYTLHADDRAAVAAALDGPVRAWLPGALALRIGTRRVVALEACAGWALAAVRADDTLPVPDAVALTQQRRLGQAGPWPDALLALLRAFRGLASKG